ncbi:MAG TPA: hypothetical protein VK525_21165 [Candidatus Saccharimonadales bacterium]|nr:hypothetical protein [Candidatus Saccharimonadales bacterium]
MRIVGAALVIAIAATIYFWPAAQNKVPANGRNSDSPFGVEEQAYAARLRLENLTMSRAENFLNQEVTTLSIELVNGGDRSLRALELTAEFSDDLRQIVLRETRPVLTPGAARFAPGDRRTFEISFEHIPTSWNMQQPTLRVAGMQFVPKE